MPQRWALAPFFHKGTILALANRVLDWQVNVGQAALHAASSIYFFWKLCSYLSTVLYLSLVWLLARTGNTDWLCFRNTKDRGAGPRISDMGEMISCAAPGNMLRKDMREVAIAGFAPTV